MLNFDVDSLSAVWSSYEMTELQSFFPKLPSDSHQLSIKHKISSRIAFQR